MIPAIYVFTNIQGRHVRLSILSFLLQKSVESYVRF